NECHYTPVCKPLFKGSRDWGTGDHSPYGRSDAGDGCRAAGVGRYFGYRPLPGRQRDNLRGQSVASSGATLAAPFASITPNSAACGRSVLLNWSYGAAIPHPASFTVIGPNHEFHLKPVGASYS